MVQLELNVIALRAKPPAFKYLDDHRSSDNIPTRKIFGRRRVALHKPLAIAVNKISAFATTAFCYQRTGTCNAGGMKLPHFHILHRYAGSQRHAKTVTSAHQRICSRRINAARPTCGQYRAFGGDVHHFAGLNAKGDDSGKYPILIFHEIDGKPLVHEGCVRFHVSLVESVQ